MGCSLREPWGLLKLGPGPWGLLKPEAWALRPAEAWGLDPGAC
jgi:hypothetical protein